MHKETTSNWDVLFHLKSVHEQVNINNDDVINIFSNFVPNKIIEINNLYPPWMNDFIKNKIKQKNKAFKLNKNNRMSDNISNLQNLLQDLSELIPKRKEGYSYCLAKN